MLSVVAHLFHSTFQTLYASPIIFAVLFTIYFMYEVQLQHSSHNLLTSSLELKDKDAIDVMERRKELHLKREERMARKLRKDMEKAKKKQAEVVKVGILMPDKMGEEEIKRELEWWEEEMKHREKMHAQQLEKEALHAAQLNELSAKEHRLEELKSAWQTTTDKIQLEEEELERIQKEFEEKLAQQLLVYAEKNGEASMAQVSRVSRMKEEAEKRALRKALKQDYGGDPEQQARNSLLRQIEEKTCIEKEATRLRKEVGLMRQKLFGQEKSHCKVMNDEKVRRQGESPKDIPPVAELYTPIRRAVAKQEVLRSHQARMLEAQKAKNARRAAQSPSSSSSNSNSNSSGSGSNVDNGSSSSGSNADNGSSSSKKGGSVASAGAHQ